MWNLTSSVDPPVPTGARPGPNARSPRVRVPSARDSQPLRRYLALRHTNAAGYLVRVPKGEKRQDQDGKNAPVLS